MPGFGAAAILAVLALAVSGCQPGDLADDLGFRAEDMTFTDGEMEALALPPEIQIPPPPEAQAASTRPRVVRSGSARVEVSDLEAAVSRAIQRLSLIHI